MLYLNISLFFSATNYLNQFRKCLNEYLRLFRTSFPKSGILKKDSVIARMIDDIPENDWKDQVQIIGWMYQFYISKKKGEVFASKKPITKDTIAAVTQLFTPDWIVRFMAENSIGRIWLESYPESPLNDIRDRGHVFDKRAFGFIKRI
jgi:hypothetical protein